MISSKLETFAFFLTDDRLGHLTVIHGDGSPPVSLSIQSEAHIPIQRQQDNQSLLSVGQRRCALMRHNELDRLIMSPRGGVTGAAIIAASSTAIGTSASTTAKAPAEAIAAATEARSVLVQRLGANDHSPNAQGQVKKSKENDDGIETDQRRDELSLVFLREPVASRFIVAPSVRLCFAFLDSWLFHVPSISNGNHTPTTFQECKQTAKGRDSEKGDDAFVASGLARGEAKIGDCAEKGSRYYRSSVGEVHSLVMSLETHTNNNDRGDIDPSGQNSKKRLKNGVGFRRADGQGMVERRLRRRDRRGTIGVVDGRVGDIRFDAAVLIESPPVEGLGEQKDGPSAEYELHIRKERRNAEKRYVNRINDIIHAVIVTVPPTVTEESSLFRHNGGAHPNHMEQIDEQGDGVECQSGHDAAEAPLFAGVNQERASNDIKDATPYSGSPSAVFTQIVEPHAFDDKDGYVEENTEGPRDYL